MAVVIIAEAGVNHNGDIEVAKQLIDVAANAKVDYVKFQTFKADTLVNKDAQKAAYQQANTRNNDSQYNMLKKLELSEKDHDLLIIHCEKRKVKFLSTGFDLESIDYLSKGKIDFIKIPSGEATNYPYLKNCATKNLPIILSTGMCTLDEVKSAIKVLTDNGTQLDNITVLHCNTEYPTPIQDVNLLAMLTMKKELGVAVGYSDHTLGIEIPIAATALGATVIEKHFTLDRNMEGPDHKASLEPNELKQMVLAIRNIEKAMGNGVKEPSNSEKKNIPVARKSIHVKYDVPANTILSEDLFIMKRPGDGISPMEYKLVVGKKLKVDLLKDHKLTWEDLV